MKRTSRTGILRRSAGAHVGWVKKKLLLLVVVLLLHLVSYFLPLLNGAMWNGDAAREPEAVGNINGMNVPFPDGVLARGVAAALAASVSNEATWRGDYDCVDLEALSRSVTALRQNLWKPEEPLCFDGIAWSRSSESVREGAAVLLLNALKLNWTVRTLVLRNTALDLKASKALSEVFSRNCPLQSISMSKLRFNSSCAGMPPILFEIMFLQELALEECALLSESCLALGKMLRNSREIRSLTLQNLTLGSCAWMNDLKSSKSLTILNLRTVPLSTRRLNKLLSVISESSTLSTVTLDDMNICEKNSKALSNLVLRNNHLRVLSLRNNRLRGSSLNWILSLTENTTLEALYLSQNPIGDVGANALVSLLQGNSTLHTLCISYCEILQSGCDCIARGVATFTGLRYLYADGNEMELCGAQVAESLVCENTVLRHVLNDLPATSSYDEQTVDIWRHIDFYLRLNKTNRRSFNTGNAEIVADFLPNLLQVAASDKPDVLYYYLRTVLPALANQTSY